MLFSKEDLAKSQGLKVFDCALPQNWIDELTAGNETEYRLLLNYCVYCYDNSLFGFPVGLTPEAKKYLSSRGYEAGNI